MIELLPGIRNTPRALIIRQDKILLLKKECLDRGEYYSLPGGGQEIAENIKETLQRECIEEVGATVDVGDLMFVADFFRFRNTQPPTQRHLVEFIFMCTISDDYVARNGNHPDKHQKEVVWIAINRIVQLSVYPHYLSNCLQCYQDKHRQLYLGAFHDKAID